MTSVVVSGALANKYRNGGNAWTRLQWVLGFERLGFEVHFLEQIDPANCVDAAGHRTAFEDSANLAYFRQVLGEFGRSDSGTLLCGEGEQSFGLQYADLLDLAAEAALLVNISGHLTSPALLRRFRRKVFLDDDPGFTQFWHAAGHTAGRLGGHDFYYTYGENIGSPGCPIPSCGLEWRPIRPPVVLDEWPVADEGDRSRLTTVASWRGPYGPVEFGSQTYGLKLHEFRRFVRLPRLTPQRFEIALEIHPADDRDRRLLVENGWEIVAPETAVPDPAAYRQYVQASGGEFSAAKGIYVQTNSGWFSDRTACYLASGLPALVQDTGFGKHLPVGEGLLTFRDLDEAIAGAHRLEQDYAAHRQAARSIAETYFDSDRVIGRLIADIDVAP